MDAFSKSAAEQIFESYPEWKAYAREETYDGATYLVVDVPPPASANAEHGLRIDTHNDEITVSFDFYHSHFDTWNVREVGSEHEAALPFVQAILSEKVGVASWWRGTEWRGSTHFSRGERPHFEFAKDYNRLRVRSWQGNLNEDRDA
ncbi:MAG TPA: hypothetical protein VFB99_18085 [Vicinamibacterales bacterium]|nr:hypothetical protein [Vicinamibacterales bacterium]HZM33798.1 hypothetical protein [Burkholderiales bacterium]